MDVTSDLRAYYEEEAARELRPELRVGRVDLRDRFLALLVREQRRFVVDFGAGPGRDGSAFVDADITFVGLDLARGNCVIAAEAGVTVVQASIASPPFRARCFEAGWSMSTLMHVTESEVPETLAAMASVLQRGAPLQVCLWGGESREFIDDKKIEGQRRLFSLRPADANRRFLEAIGTVEASATWDTGPDGWEYQGFLVRVHA